MDFENFKEQLLDAVKESLYERGIEAKLSHNHINKLNEAYEAMTVTPIDSKVGVNLNITKMYESYEDGMQMNEIILKATDMVERGFSNQPAVDVDSLTDYSQMKNKLIMEVVSIENNAEMLDKIPHKEMEDMAVVYRFVIDNDSDSRATILVTNDLIATMGITAEQLHEDAMENSPVLKPPVIKGMTEVMSEMMGMSAEDMEMMGMSAENEQMYVASVPDKIHGAGVLAYQDFMEQASERIGGGDFFILPSSLHEILIVPDNGAVELEALKSMVQEVNATEVSPEDKLTDSVYHYDSKDKIFELGEKFEERMANKEKAKDMEKTDEKKSVLKELKAKKEDVAKQPRKDPAKNAKDKNVL